VNLPVAMSLSPNRPSHRNGENGQKN